MSANSQKRSFECKCDGRVLWQGMPFSWQWNGGNISPNLWGIWEMSV